MSYQVLARKWRPRNFDELVGQEHVVRALRNALDGDRMHHAFLFTGTRGVGKTTLARILAKCLNCDEGMSSRPCGKCPTCCEVDEGRFVDLIEVDAASRAKVDQTRELMDNVQFAPTKGRHKVYLIDEVHMFSTASFNALLKTLEEPPPHVKFLLATTDPQKVPVTVLSRCLQFNLKRLPAASITKQLQNILEQEQIGHEAGALQLVARAADGSMRDALSLLDQAIAYGGGKLELDEVRGMLGTVDRQRVTEVLEALRTEDAESLLDAAASMRDAAVDPADALDELARCLQRVAVLQAVPGSADTEDELDRLAAELANGIAPEDVQLFYQAAITGRRDLALAPDPQLGFEMTLLRMLAFRPAASEVGPHRPTPAGPGGGGSAQPRLVAGPEVTPAQAARQAAGIGGSRGRNVTGRQPAASAEDPGAPAGADAESRMLAPQALGEARAAVVLPATEVPGGADTSSSVAGTDFDEIELMPASNVGLPAPAQWPVWVVAQALPGLVGELAAHTQLIAVDGERLTLRIDEGRRQLATERLRAQLARHLSALTGKSILVELHFGKVDAQTGAELSQRQAAQRHAAAVEAITGDPSVQAICKAFGAQVDPTLVRALD